MADAPDALTHAAALIGFDTSNYGPGEANGERAAAEYVATALSDAGHEPAVLESAPNRTNVLVRIPGTEPDLPAVLAHAHLDVVPARAEDWSVPPFAGEVRDGYLWGRGATDMKDMAAMLLAVAGTWSAQGRTPRRDVVLAFVADEEAGGAYGAEWLVDEHPGWFTGCAAAISETGGYTFPVTAAGGRPVRLYPIATAERGTLHLRLRARGRAGHASRPNDENPVSALADALARLAGHEWPVLLTPAVTGYLQRASAACGVSADLSTSDGVLAAVGALGEAGAPVVGTLRNSTTPTVLRAGYAVNVIPSEAVAEVDTRSLPGAEDDLLATVDGLLGDRVRREFIAHNPAVSAPVDSPWFAAMAAALVAEDPDAVPVPFCMGGGTDAKAFARLGIAGYGFAPLLLPADYDYRAMPHGVDERIPVDALEFGTRVLDRFLSH